MSTRGDTDRPFTRYVLSLSHPGRRAPSAVEALVVLVSELGKLLTDMPPDYPAAWREDRPDLVAYAATVSSLVCRLRREARSLDAPGTPILLRAGLALDGLRTLLDTWIERWGIRFHAETGFNLWSSRHHQGAGARIGNLDAGPPCIEMLPEEVDRLKWVFRQLRDAAERIDASRQPEPQANSSASPPTHAVPGEDTKPPKAEDDRPTDDELRAYYAAERGVRQKAIGDELDVSQPTVSRMIQKVKAWKVKGNRMPGLEELTRPSVRPRTFTVDPRKMGRVTREDAE
jgi:hypothetical protein